MRNPDNLERRPTLVFRASDGQLRFFPRTQSVGQTAEFSGPYYLRALKDDRGFLEESDGTLIMEKVPHKGVIIPFPSPRTSNGQGRVSETSLQPLFTPERPGLANGTTK